MACISALAFCVSHRDFHDEEILVQELSKVKEQVSQRLQYFASKQLSKKKPVDLKDQVQRFLSKLSTFLDLPEDCCFELLVHYLATHSNNGGGFDEDQVQNFVTDGHISDLLNRIRIFYWQERLSLLGLLRLTLCDWHESWSSVADVLFAMTPYASRTEMLKHVLKEYMQAASDTESLLADGRFGSMRLIQPTGFNDFESQDEFDVIVSHRLKEQLEMLNILLTGVHALCDSATPSSSCFFSKLLEAFWSKSFGLQPAYVQSLAKHRQLVERICFMQTLILIRSANLDSLCLFWNTDLRPEPDFAANSRSTNRTSKRSSSGQPTEVHKTVNRKHFLQDARLLNRLLASLSGLGDSPVHGPLLLFGAVCATAFAPSLANGSITADPPLDCGVGGGDDDANDASLGRRQSFGDRKAAKGEMMAVSETSYLVAGQYAQTAIDTLRVFGFFSEQLTNLGKPTAFGRNTDQASSTVYDGTVWQTDSDLGIIEFCAHVAVFDLLSLMAQHVVLWSLDNKENSHTEQMTSAPPDAGSDFGLPNRSAFIRLFARALRVVAYHSQLIVRCRSDAPSVLESAGIGQRIAGLIESLAEGFPLDLSLLHLCIALMVPTSPHRASHAEADGASLVNLVSDLITALPYLTEALTPQLQRIIQHASVSWYPQFGRGDQLVPSNEIVLTQARTLMAVDSRQRSSDLGTADRQRCTAVPVNLFAGVRLATGTRGKVEPDLGWVAWKHEYPVWSVVMHEVHKAFALLNRLHSSYAPDQPSPPPAKGGKTVCDSLNRSSVTGVEQSRATIYRALFDQLVRVNEFARLLAACVQAQVHISTCLYLVEDLWLLILRCLSQTASNTVTMEFAGTKTESCSISDLLYDRLIPCVLRLLASAFAGLSAQGCMDLLTEHATLWNLVLFLTESGRFFPRLVRSRAGNQSKLHFSLAASHLSSQLTPYLTGPVLETSPSSSSFSTVLPRGRHSLLLSYLEFLFGLLTGVKWMCSLNRSSIVSPSTAKVVEPWIYHGAELLKGGLLVTVTGVIAGVLRSDRWAVTSSQSAMRSDQDQWLLRLAEQSFLLLTDLLTTHVSELEIRRAAACLDDSISSGAGTKASSDGSPPQLLAALQSLALRLLLDNPSALQGLLTFSSIPYHCLVAQFKAFDHGLSIGDPSVWGSSSGNNTGSPRRLSMTRSISNVVWFGLTLVHHVLGLEHAICNQGDRSTGLASPPLLSSLMAYVDPGTREHYIAVLFTYLRYPYNVGLPRGAVTLLKWLTQNSSMTVVDYLSPESGVAVRDCVLHRLSSPTDDQLTRVALFDLIAETVLTSASVDRSGKRVQPQFLRFLSPTAAAAAAAVAHDRTGTASGGKSTASQTSQADCLDCCVAVLNEVKTACTDSDVPDQLSLLLLANVAKLIAALYLQDAHTYIGALKSKPNFWSLLSDPVFQLLGADKKRQVELSNIEYEYCGHVASILGLELFSTLSFSGCPKLGTSFQSVLNQLATKDIYCLWFRLVAGTLRRLNSADETNYSEAESVQPVLHSLYEATCRWKCLLMAHLDLLLNSTETTNLTALEPGRVIDQLIQCLHQLKPFFNLPGATDLGNQLAVCLSVTLNHHVIRAPGQTTDDGPSASASPASLAQLAQLVDFLMIVRPGADEQSRHMHADLLACCNFMWQRVVMKSSVAVDSQTAAHPDSDDARAQLHADLLDCAFGYTAQLAVYAELSAADESALRQAINLLLRLWDDELFPQLGERLIEAGVLNNLLVTLDQYKQSRASAALCHDIVTVVMRILCSTSSAPKQSSSSSAATAAADRKMDVPVEDDDQSESLRWLSNAQVVSSYGDLLAQAFYWPSVDVLLQWIREDELASNHCLDPESDCHRTTCSAGTWIQVILSQLHCLCMLHDSLGGLNQPFVARLLDRFCTENGAQLEALFRHWCDGLYEAADGRERALSCLPWTAAIMHDGGLLPPIRLELARAVGALYWRLLVAGQSLNASALVSGSGLPTVGASLLYRPDLNGVSDAKPYLPTYGPNASGQFSTHIWHLAEWQVHCCSVLLQRFGLQLSVTKSGPVNLSGNPVATTSASNSGTPIKTSAGLHSRTAAAASSPRRPQTPTVSAWSAEVASPLPGTSTSLGTTESGPNACSGERELTCLIQHLIMCLNLLVTQMPLLGSMALFTSEELLELRPCVQLVFSTPSLEDNSPQLTFGVLITLAHSLSHLYLKVSRHTRSEPTGAKSLRELGSLLAQAHEMTLAILLSQASLILVHGQASPAEKQLLVRELTSELKSCNLLGRSSRRRHSLGHRSSHSPSSRSSSTARQLHRTASTHTPVPVGSIAAAAAADLHSVGTTLKRSDLSSFGFELAMERFAELLRLSSL